MSRESVEDEPSFPICPAEPDMTRPTVLLIRRLRPLLDRTLDLSPEELEAFLERLARDEPADAQEVAALLAVEPALDAANFLSDVLVDRAGKLTGRLRF